MAKHETRGIGVCGTPGCKRPRAPDSYLCSEHVGNIRRIREELEGDPRLLYHQSSKSNKRRVIEGSKVMRKRVQSVPTCCYVGCYNHRIPPDAFCETHSDQVQD